MKPLLHKGRTEAASYNDGMRLWISVTIFSNPSPGPRIVPHVHAHARVCVRSCNYRRHFDPDGGQSSSKAPSQKVSNKKVLKVLYLLWSSSTQPLFKSIISLVNAQARASLQWPQVCVINFILETMKSWVGCVSDAVKLLTKNSNMTCSQQEPSRVVKTHHQPAGDVTEKGDATEQFSPCPASCATPSCWRKTRTRLVMRLQIKRP